MFYQPQPMIILDQFMLLLLMLVQLVIGVICITALVLEARRKEKDGIDYKLELLALLFVAVMNSGLLGQAQAFTTAAALFLTTCITIGASASFLNQRFGFNHLTWTGVVSGIFLNLSAIVFLAFHLLTIIIPLVA